MLELRRIDGSSTPSGGGGRLPAGYQEVEWIEFFGKQYLKISLNNIIEKGDIFNYKYRVYQNTLIGIFSTPSISVVGEGTAHMARYNENGKSHIRWFRTVGTSDTLGNNILGVDVTERVSFPTLTMNDVDYTITSNSESLYQQMTILIGCMFYGNLPRNYMVGRYYHFSIQDKLNLIPCRRLSDNVKGMYDIVNDVFYTNAGEGEFSVGPDVIA